MNYSLRRADNQDAELVAAIDSAIFESQAWTLAMWQAELSQSFNHIILAVPLDNSSKPIGFVSASILDNAIEIRKIGSLIPFRKKGVGLRCLEAVERLRQEHRKEKIILEVSEKNTSAIAFYQKNGFVTISIRPRYYQDNSAAHCMAKSNDKMLSAISPP